METPKTPKKYDLVRYYKSPPTKPGEKTVATKVATLFYNLPYAIIKFKKDVAETDKSLPKGTFFKIEPNLKSNETTNKN